jgi:hypothetical protein
MKLQYNRGKNAAYVFPTILPSWLREEACCKISKNKKKEETQFNY